MIGDLSGFNDMIWDLGAFLVYLFPFVMFIKVIETFFLNVGIHKTVALFVSDGKISESEMQTMESLESFFWVWTRIRATVIMFFVGWILILFIIEYGKYYGL